jgi:hypothetical protein
MTAPTEPALIRSLAGVYHADGTLTGELAYWIGARLGRTHCSLCDITHGLFRQKESWKACSEGLPVRVTMFHRNDQPDDVRRAAGDITPVVTADTTEGTVMLLGPADIDACNGDPERLIAAIEAAVDHLGLRWT